MDTRQLRSLPLGTGAVVGAVAYVLGYAFTYLLASDHVREGPFNQVVEFASGSDATYELVAWVFYNAHFVPALVEVDLPFVGGTDAVNFVSQSDALSPLLYLVPVVLLLGGGLAVCRRVQPADAGEAALSGASVALGYLPLAVVGAFLSRIELGSSTGGPDLLLAVVLAGLAYPLVIGAVGGVVAGVTD